jgi:3-deoxy-alpha-D-manno-octulosonate 8-oxidase
MKKIAMIPARYAATRFPGKLMQDLGGKSVIARTFESIKATQLFDEVYVVTDSEIIFEEIKAHGGLAIMSKKNHECGSDRIAEAIEFMDVDIVVNVQGGEDATNVDLATLMTKMTDWNEVNDPNFVKVVVDENNYALYFSRSPIPYPRDRNIPMEYYEHKGIYAFRKKALMDFYQLPMRNLETSEKIECLRYLEYGKKIKLAISTTKNAVEIDTPEDLLKANKIISKNN